MHYNVSQESIVNEMILSASHDVGDAVELHAHHTARIILRRKWNFSTCEFVYEVAGARDRNLYIGQAELLRRIKAVQSESA